MATQAEILESMQNTKLFGAKVNRSEEGTDAVKVITYEFAGTTAPDDYFGAGQTGWSDFSDAEKALIKQAMDEMETFLNVEFQVFVDDPEVNTDEPDVNFGKVDVAGGPTTSFGIERTLADVATDPDDATVTESQVTSYDAYVLFDNDLDMAGAYEKVLQLLGHAMGLKNSFVGPVVPDGTDSHKYTVMSNQLDPDSGGFAAGYQAFDILALQDLWGAVTTGNDGDTSYLGDDADSVQVVTDASGTDIFDASAQTEAVQIDLRQGATSTFDATHDLAIAVGSVIENATGGTGDDSINGNEVANLLKGDKGADTLNGYEKADILKGGNGADELNGGKGRDILRGGRGDDNLSGDELGDKLFGGKGKDTLNGGSGNDTLTGGDDADVFVFNTAEFGKDKITDFENDLDTLSFTHSEISTVDAAIALAAEVGGDVVFTFADGSIITVENSTIAALTDDISII